MAFSAGVDGSHTCDWPLCDARLLSYGLHQHQEDGRLLHLLLTLRTQLAPPRRNDVGLAEACRSDVAQLCAEEPEGAVLGCLHRNRKKLSKACRAEEVRMDVMQARAAAAAGRSALQAENRVCIWLVLRLKFNNFCFGCTPQATTDKLELFLAANSCVQSESIDLRPSVAAACREELTGHCPHMPPGSGHSLNCLLAMVVVHGHDFSPVCLEVLDTLQEHRMFDLRTGGWAMPARRQGRGCACLSTESRVAVAGNAALGGGSSAGRLPGLQHSTAQHSTAQHSTAQHYRAAVDIHICFLCLACCLLQTTSCAGRASPTSAAPVPRPMPRQTSWTVLCCAAWWAAWASSPAPVHQRSAGR